MVFGNLDPVVENLPSAVLGVLEQLRVMRGILGCRCVKGLFASEGVVVCVYMWLRLSRF